MSFALIAGTGGLPPLLADALVAQGKSPLICEMRGFTSEIEGNFERENFRIETIGTFLQTLQKRGVKQVCMAGAVARPSVNPMAIDAATMPLVPRFQAAMSKGDDGTLREIIAIFEDHGFEVLGAHEIAPQLLPPAGVHSKVQPLDLTDDLAAGKAALAEMGKADLGQAMVLRGGEVIAREGASGTAAMLESLSEPTVAHKGSGDPLVSIIETFSDLAIDTIDLFTGGRKKPDPKTDPAVTGEGAILFKAPKPDQNLLADMPTIGPDTAVQAAAAGLAGIVITHGSVMVLDLPDVIATLDAHGMFFLVTP